MQKPITLPTLGGQSSFNFRYVEGEGIKINSHGPLAFEQAELILDRFEQASPEDKGMTGYYNQPRWEECPNRNIAPWIAGVLHHFENSTL